MKKRTLPALPPIPPEKKFFKISEASRLVGVPEHVLRYWEEKIPQLSPIRRGSNQRKYRPKDIQIARKIRELKYAHELTIEGIKSELSGIKVTVDLPEDDQVVPEPVQVQEKPIKEVFVAEDVKFVDEMITSLEDIREFLRNK